MGCGPSQDLPPPDTCPENNNKATPNGFVTRGNAKEQPEHQLRDDQKPLRQSAQVSKQISVPRAVVFDVPLDDADKTDIIRRYPPKRLQHLEPVESAPQITAEILEEKLRHAEQKRLQELERVKATSRKTSRAQRDILMAKRFEEEQQQKKELEEKLKSAEKNRESKLKEIEEKKQLREERAKRIRAKAQRLQEEGGELDFEIEKDETFNEDYDDDSWLNGETTHSANPSPPQQGGEEGDWEMSHLETSDWEKSRERSELSGRERGRDPRQRLGSHREGESRRRLDDNDDDDGFFG